MVMRITTRCIALRYVDKLIGYNDMLGSTDVDSTAGKYMFKKVSREILNLIGELSQLFFTGNAQSISDKLGILFSENSYDFDKAFILLDKLKREIDEFPAKYRVLFLPYKYSMWDSLESIYEAAEKDPECESYVMPIPYYDKDGHDNMIGMHDESDLYPKDLDIVSWREHTVDEINPDIIFIHNPYDDGNLVTSIHPDYYTWKLVRDDRLVVYVPYYVSYTDDPDILTSLGFAGIYADYVITQSEWYRNEYERCLDKYRDMGDNARAAVDYYDNGHKFAVLGNPKYDKVAILTKKSYLLSDDWHDALFCGAGQRLTLLLDTTVELVLKQRENVELYRHTGKPAVMLDLGGTDSSVRDYDEEALSGKVHAGEVLREEELGMGTVLEFCREYQYVPADFEQKETFGERIYKFSKEALVRKISK